MSAAARSVRRARPGGRQSVASESGETNAPLLPVDRGRLGATATMALIVVAAVALQIHLGTVDDVSWLITAGERTLNGQTPYRDFIEVNPPASILLYLPAIVVARLIGASPELIVAAFGFAGAAASLALCGAILARARLIDALGPVGASVALAALTLLPAHVFDERDMIAAVAALPFLALAAARASGARAAPGHVLLAGLGAGIMAAIKPPYALAALALAPYLAARIGLRGLMTSLEFYVAAAVGLVYALVTLALFPAYISDILPLARAVYLPVREPALALMLNTGVILWLALLLASAQIAAGNFAAPLFAIPALASLGAVASFIVQGKGWSYHIYPALAFAVIAHGAALAHAKRPIFPLAAAVACAIAAALVALALGRWPVQIMIGVALAAALLSAAAHRLFAKGAPRDETEPTAVIARSEATKQPRGGSATAAKSGLLRFARNDGAPSDLPLGDMIAASAIGVAFALFASEGLPQPILEQALARLGSHPTMLAISESLAFGHPLAREVGGIWVQRVPSLWITGAAERLIGESGGDAALRAKLAPFMRADRQRLLDDSGANKPDAILIGRIGGAAYKAFWSDPDIVAALASYRFFAGNDNSDWPAMVYARRDLIGLRARTEPDAVQ